VERVHLHAPGSNPLETFHSIVGSGEMNIMKWATKILNDGR
jgi:hypothetical protein